MKESSPEGVHVWLILLKAFQAVDKLSTEGLQASNLGESDFRVLEVLLHKGALPVNTIGPKVNLTAGSISAAVERLHARGLVSRIEDPHDRRVRVVDLTPDGRALIQPVFRSHAALMEKVAAVLSPAERTQLERLLKKIGHQAEALSRRSSAQA